MKVIKNTPANDRIAWNSDNENDVKWPESELYQYLNTEYYQTLPIELKEKIVNATWNYGDVINPWFDEDNQNIFTPEELEKFNELYGVIARYDENKLTDDQKRDKIKELSKMYSDALVKRENELTDDVKANIGLMSLTDYCSSFGSNGRYNCMTSY